MAYLEVKKVNTSLLRARRLRGHPGSTEGARHFFCMHEVDVASQELQDI
jgi:hypothetical protein